MIVKGIEVRNRLREDIIKETSKRDYSLHMIRLGNNQADISYERGIIKTCEAVNVLYKVHKFSSDVKEDELLSLIDELNKDEKVDGIVIFRPLPKTLNEEKILNSINPLKDIDCSTNKNLSNIFLFKDTIEPATARGVMEFLKYNNIKLKGKKVLIINRSIVLGRPLSMMMLNQDATVTMAHSKSENLDDLMTKRDIIVSAIGCGKFHNKDIFNKNQILIDVGMSVDNEGNLSGDFDINLLKDKVKIITPVIGGIGSITNTILVLNTLKAKKLREENYEG